MLEGSPQVQSYYSKSLMFRYVDLFSHQAKPPRVVYVSRIAAFIHGRICAQTLCACECVPKGCKEHDCCMNNRLDEFLQSLSHAVHSAAPCAIGVSTGGNETTWENMERINLHNRHNINNIGYNFWS